MRNNYTHLTSLSTVFGILALSLSLTANAQFNAKTIDDLLRLDAQAAGAVSSKTVKSTTKGTVRIAPKADSFDVLAIFGTGDKLKAIVTFNQDKPRAVQTGEVIGNYKISEIVGRCLTFIPTSTISSLKASSVKTCFAPKVVTSSSTQIHAQQNTPHGLISGFASSGLNALGQPITYPPPLPLKLDIPTQLQKQGQ